MDNWRTEWGDKWKLCTNVVRWQMEWRALWFEHRFASVHLQETHGNTQYVHIDLWKFLVLVQQWSSEAFCVICHVCSLPCWLWKKWRNMLQTGNRNSNSKCSSSYLLGRREQSCYYQWCCWKWIHQRKIQVNILWAGLDFLACCCVVAGSLLRVAIVSRLCHLLTYKNVHT